MSDGHIDKSPTHQPHHKASGHSQASLSYPVRRMRNTAVLVKWIEEHQTNPYPTKAEKQYLAYYSGMNLTQLSTWFANARRRIKKIGMKTWLEGRSTFTVDFFPSRPAMHTDYGAPGAAPSYHSLSAATAGHYSPYAISGLTNSYPSQHASPGLTSLQTTSSQRIHNGAIYTVTDASTIQQSASTSAINGGLYGSGSHSARASLSSQPGMMAMMGPFSNWPMASPASALLPGVNVSLHSGRHGSNIGPLQSPLTAQVYTGDATHLRSHSAQSLDDTSYSLAQHSPDQMLPECASTEPMLQDGQKSQSTITN